MLDEKLDFQKFVNLIDNVFDEIFIWDKNMRVVYANDACYRHYGFSPDYFIGRRLEEFSGTEFLWTPSLVPRTFRSKRPLIMHQKTLRGVDMVTISVPVFDEDGDVEYVVQSVRDAQEYLFREVESVTGDNQLPDGGDIVYASESMKHIMEYLEKVAPTKAPILILGETGVGKTFLARHIHAMSDRRDKPFLTVNLASLSPSVIEAEFFGYAAGAFTGARREGKKGIFESANGGTLFLDEIGDFPCDLQAKFLHVLQDEEFIPVGGTKPIKLDVRMIYATNCDLRRNVEAGKFRKDLYQRINMMEITIPPLRERKEDLHLLAAHFLRTFNQKYHRNTYFSKEVTETFEKYQWGGNIRELSNSIERMVIVADEDALRVRDLPEGFFSVDYYQNDAGPQYDSAEDKEEQKRRQVIEAYKTHPSSRKLAKALGVSQSTANRMIRRYIRGEEGKDS